MTKFSTPQFRQGQVQVSVSGDEVAIYATPDGLRRLAHCCEELIAGLGSETTRHVHLEDRGLIEQSDSVSRVVLAVFHSA